LARSLRARSQSYQVRGVKPAKRMLEMSFALAAIMAHAAKPNYFQSVNIGIDHGRCS
jgi:hypothetical protein